MKIMDEKEKKTLIRVRRGEPAALARLFKRCTKYVSRVLRGEWVSGDDAERIRRAAIERGGVEYERVNR
jgi:hypothetical protein